MNRVALQETHNRLFNWLYAQTLFWHDDEQSLHVINLILKTHCCLPITRLNYINLWLLHALGELGEVLFNYRKTNTITTTTAVPVRSRSPTTATTAPATAPELELSVGSTAARVTFTATVTVEKNNKLAELCQPLTVSTICHKAAIVSRKIWTTELHPRTYKSLLPCVGSSWPAFYKQYIFALWLLYNCVSPQKGCWPSNSCREPKNVQLWMPYLRSCSYNTNLKDPRQSTQMIS